MRNHLSVVAGVFIDDKKRVFCAKRKDKGDLALMWEFPGGKIEIDEQPEEALRREIFEELNVVVYNMKHFLTVSYSYPSFDITLKSYICNGSFVDLVLNDHDDFKWVNIPDLTKLDWANADWTIVKKIIEVYQ